MLPVENLISDSKDSSRRERDLNGWNGQVVVLECTERLSHIHDIQQVVRYVRVQRHVDLGRPHVHQTIHLQ